MADDTTKTGAERRDTPRVPMRFWVRDAVDGSAFEERQGDLAVGGARSPQAFLRGRHESRGQSCASRRMTGLRNTILAGSALVLTGCGMLTATREIASRPTVGAQASASAHALRQAETLAREGKPGPAQELYLTIREQFPQDPAAPQALYRLGVLQADPLNPLKDYRAARATFTRLLAEYPRHPWDTDARAWQATLTELLLREDDARRLSHRLRKAEEDLVRMRTGLERLKHTDLENERRR
jgi:hypothetical protein